MTLPKIASRDECLAARKERVRRRRQLIVHHFMFDRQDGQPA